jgi:hypothetical protein
MIQKKLNQKKLKEIKINESREVLKVHGQNENLRIKDISLF